MPLVNKRIVESALTTGDEPERIIAKMYMGKVCVEPLEQKKDKTKSSKEIINTSNADTSNDGESNGNTIRQNVCHDVAPKSNDAST